MHKKNNAIWEETITENFNTHSFNPCWPVREPTNWNEVPNRNSESAMKWKLIYVKNNDIKKLYLIK